MSQLSNHYVALVTAAGIGSRMQAELPKQYLPLDQRCILEHSIEVLLAHPAVSKVVVALHPEDTYFEALALASNPNVSTVIGGDERADSVLAGLQVLAEQDWVLVHDAARPCLRAEDIDALIASAEAGQGAILAAPVVDTIKQQHPHTEQAGMQQPEPQQIAQTVDRTTLWRAFTPQLFNVAELRENLSNALEQGLQITDEASAMELAGAPVTLISGATDNIKITRPEDLALAKWFLQQQGRLNNQQEKTQ